MKQPILIPTFISTLRIGALPLFFYLYDLGNITSCLVLLAFCATTDFADGYIARKLKANSTFGAYYDSTADFTLMAGIFAIFTLNGYYPVWLVLLMATSFTQFLVTSHYAKKLYDPVGRYLGSALYIGITLTLLLPMQAIYSFVQYAFLGLFVFSLVSRIASLTRKRV